MDRYHLSLVLLVCLIAGIVCPPVDKGSKKKTEDDKKKENETASDDVSINYYSMKQHFLSKQQTFVLTSIKQDFLFCTPGCCIDANVFKMLNCTAMWHSCMIELTFRKNSWAPS